MSNKLSIVGAGGGGGGSSSIGGAVTGGTDDAILFINPAGILAQDPTNLHFDKTLTSMGIGTNAVDATLHIQTDDTKNLITLIVDQNDVTNDTRALQINQAANAEALDINTSATTADVINIDADTITANQVIDISADALTLGKIFEATSTSADTSTRSLMLLDHSASAATGVTVANFVSDSAGSNTVITHTPSVTGSGTVNSLDITHTNSIGGTDTSNAVNVSLTRTNATGINTAAAFAATGTHDAGGTGELRGVDLTLSGADQNTFLNLSNTVDEVKVLMIAGSPEGVVGYEADIGSLCIDSTNGKLYQKKTDTTNTGWEEASKESEVITQAAHGFTLTNNVPLPAYRTTGGVIALARANDDTTMAVMYINSIIDANNFEVTYSGFVTATGHSLTAGEYYFLSEATAGAVASTVPAADADGAVRSQPVFFVNDANSLVLLSNRAVKQAGLVEVSDADKTLSADTLILAYTTITAARAVTLPAAASVAAGRVYHIKDTSGNASGVNTITVAGVDGGSAVITAAYGSVSVFSDSSSWYSL